MKTKKAFTLVELMIVVVILGILAAIAIPLYMKFVQQSKTGEAQGNLAKIASLTEEYYAKSGNMGSVAVVEPGSASTLISKLPNTTNSAYCTIAAGTVTVNNESVPRTPATVSGKSYQPGLNEWTCGSSGCTPSAVNGTAWNQMHFELHSPIRYVYCYGAVTPDTGIQSFQTVASGDLNGNLTWSSFSRNGATATDGNIHLSGLAVINEQE